MPPRGMKSLLSDYTPSSCCSSPRTNSTRESVSSPRQSFAESIIDQTIEMAASMILKWDPDSSAYAKVTSIFYEDKREARRFIKTVNELQNAMHTLFPQSSTTDKLVYAQALMECAMKRLQKEFYQILSTNRAHLDPESVSARSSVTSRRSSLSDFEFEESVTIEDEEILLAGESVAEVEEVSAIAMSDLRAIAECMISSGYAKECIDIYILIRKSIVDEGIYRLGVEKLSSSQKFYKLDWQVIDEKIKTWLEAVKVAMKTLFNGERILCDSVFASSDSIRESCFAEISKEGANLLFGFPELVAKTKKTSPEKIFRLLDMYATIAEHWPAIQSTFSFESTVPICTQVHNSLIKLCESIHGLLAEFESSIHKNSSKKPVLGGGVHFLTVHVMNYLSLLADHNTILADIFSDWTPPEKSPIQASYTELQKSSDSPVGHRIAWLILVLLCKLDGKAKHYKDIPLTYLFLANNMHHVVVKVRASNLQYILGEEWIRIHENKVKQFTSAYERLAWGKVTESLPTKCNTTEGAAEGFKRFNLSFDQAYWKQSMYVVPDRRLRDEIKKSIGRKIISAYKEFYDEYCGVEGCDVRFSPEDVGNRLSDLFFGASVSSMGTLSLPASQGSSIKWIEYNSRSV